MGAGRPAVVWVLLVAGLALLSGAGCTQCDEISCEPRTPAAVLGEAEVVDVDGDVVTFAPEGTDAEPVRVTVWGPTNTLSRGHRYRVPVYEVVGEPYEYEDGTTTRLETAVPTADDCACLEGVTHVDGSTIDTSWWEQYGFVHVSIEQALLVTALTFGSVCAVWAALRRRRGVPL